MKKILYLFSDTGGGHRSAANALIAAVAKIDPKVKQEMIDVFAECSSFLNIFAKLYAPVIRYSPKLWGNLYHFWDDPKKLELLEKVATPFIQKELIERINLIKPNLIVSVHPMVNHLVANGLPGLPIITVATDPIAIHKAWVYPKVDLLVVATEEAKKLAIEYGMPEEKIKVLGLPINPRFIEKKKKREVRKMLGLLEKVPTILFMGGGEGSGGMGKLVTTVDEKVKNIQMIVICGRNNLLLNKLSKARFQHPAKVVGFTDQVPMLMDAADIIVTKGGPGSIAEAMAKDLPMIITSWLPGQEEANVKFVEEAGIGFVETAPDRVADKVNILLKTKEADKIRQNIKKVSRPHASIDIAKCILSYLK